MPETSSASYPTNPPSWRPSKTLAEPEDAAAEVDFAAGLTGAANAIVGARSATASNDRIFMKISQSAMENELGRPG